MPFEKGHPGGPGRPKGSRNKLSEAFLRVLSDDFSEHGVEVIEKLRKDSPAQYANVIAKLMPKMMELSGPDGDDIPLSGVVTFIKNGSSDEST
jgi:hypothetical protein